MHKSSAPTAAHLNRTTRDESPTNDKYDGGGPAVEKPRRPRHWVVRGKDEVRE
ncbi:hypothetical protein RHMOL_Rhmol01G0097300 [Rhododendron molle]|uniref:Uncharacterized protein n=1 Tax=Rhododendron molle TaxID=49168 RepID=A0ACC0Q333_RHOML|nr:hypothetical protein RHMOL_Rhmol01G0097300 [Rhododendron molle]